MSDVTALVEAEFKKIDNKVAEVVKKTNEEIAAHGKIGAANKQAVDALNKTVEEVMARILAVEQSAGTGGQEQAGIVTVGAQFIESDAFKAYADGQTTKASFDVQNNTVVGTDATVAPDRRAGVVPGAFRNLNISEILPSIPTASNAIEYVKESSLTDAAAEQSAEGEEYQESSIGFSLVNDPVRSIGTWLKISKQMLEDAPAVAAYINVRLMHLVEKKVDSQLVNGTGASGTLSGFLKTGNHTVFTPSSGDTELGGIRKAVTQLELADYYATAVLLNPAQVQNIDLGKDDNGAYIAANPRTANGPMAWGLPIISSAAVPANKFVMGAFDLSSILHERRNVTVEMSDSDDDNFTKDLVTIKATKRCALEINTQAAFVGGDLTAA